ncbi:MAG: hypothetical protein HIU92_14995 [Proteobacteria bacterium]|nr:hypothetical protein [Pseudomonadota bacterium]
MAEPGLFADAAAERQATSNSAAFLHWLRAVHGLRLTRPDEPLAAIRRWAEGDPATAARLILRFAGPGFPSARVAAGLLLEADLRPDDRLLVQGPAPVWLPHALSATRGRASNEAEATVLVAGDLPATLPLNLRRVILTGTRSRDTPVGVTVTCCAGWTYPRESSAD